MVVDEDETEEDEEEKVEVDSDEAVETATAGCPASGRGSRVISALLNSNN